MVIICSTRNIHLTNFSPTQHHSVQKDLELFESDFTGPQHPVLLDWRQDFIVPKARLKTTVRHHCAINPARKLRTCCIGLCPQSTNMVQCSDILGTQSEKFTVAGFSVREFPVQRLAVTFFACPQGEHRRSSKKKRHTKVKGEWVTTQKTDKTVQLSNAVLERCTRKAPARVGLEFKSRFGGVR
jgi:hypothetical protein